MRDFYFLPKLVWMVSTVFTVLFACLWGVGAKPWSTGWLSPGFTELMMTSYSGYACLAFAGLSIGLFAVMNYAEHRVGQGQ